MPPGFLIRLILILEEFLHARSFVRCLIQHLIDDLLACLALMISRLSGRR